MKRLLLDNDGSNLFGDLSDDIPGAIAEAVRECSPAVTTYLVCANAGTCYWPTEVGDVAPQLAALLAADDRGSDPFGLLLNQLKAAGKETFVTCRMNDVHDPTEDWNMPRLRRTQPDCIVGVDEVRQGKAQWMSYCLDYTRADVRHYMHELIAELIARYGQTIDGVQLDWMRFPRHLSGTPDEVWAKRGILTDFIAELRQLLTAADKGHLLSVRVPAHPAGCRLLGLDLAAWAQRGLVDLVVACPFLTTDWQLPIDAFRDLLGELPVYAGFDFGFGHQVHCPESLRGICTSLYDGEPDGIYLFNFPCWRERLAARPYHWLAGLDNPHTAAAKPLLLSVNHQRHRIAGVDQPALLPLAIGPGEVIDLPLYLPALALPAWRAICLVASSGGGLTMTINGSAALRRRGQRSEIFCEFVDRPLPDAGRTAAADYQHFHLDPTALRAGENQLTFSNGSDGERCLERLNLGLW